MVPQAKLPEDLGASSGGLNILDFGGTRSGDNTPALAAALAECWAGTQRRIYFPDGNWHFASKPPNLGQVEIVGNSPSSTVLCRDYNGDFLVFDGAHESGGGVRKLSINAGAGTSGGAALKFLADAANTLGYTESEYLVISGAGVWDWGIVYEGMARVTAPLGVRGNTLRNAKVFQTMQGALLVRHAHGLRVDDFVGNPATGGACHIKIEGGTAEEYYCSGIFIDATHLGGAPAQTQLQVSNTKGGHFRGLCGAYVPAGNVSLFEVSL